MLDFFLNRIQNLIAVYWIGGAILQNESIRCSVEHIENAYGKINDRLKEAEVKDGVIALRKIYGWGVIISFVVFILLNRHLEIGSRGQVVVIYSVLITFAGWFSIKWFIEHKKTVFELRWQFVLVIISPILYRALGIVTGEPIIETIVDEFRKFPMPGGLAIPSEVDPNIATIVMVAILLSAHIFYYLLSWVMFAPVALVSFLIVAVPIYFARLVHRFTRDKAFLGFSVFLFFGISFFQESMSR